VTVKDLHIIPKVRDKHSFLYVEHASIDKEDMAIAIHNQMGMTPVPCANLALLMLGPGVSITHAAILTLADCGCLVAWVGENAVRFYASGVGTARSSIDLMKQAAAWSDLTERMRIVRQLYQMRFQESFGPDLTIEQLRGKEGARVRDAYFNLSRQYGVPMQGRNYDRNSWKTADPINRALSVANSCLYGVCHAAIVSAGYSPGLGFIHTGKNLSFVYDVADLYKMETAAPAAFKAVSQNVQPLEKGVRIACRDMFHETNLLKRIVEDIHTLFGKEEPFDSDASSEDEEASLSLWDPVTGICQAGVSYGLDKGNSNDCPDG